MVIAVTGNWNEKTTGLHQRGNWKVWWDSGKALPEEVQVWNGRVSGEQTHVCDKMISSPGLLTVCEVKSCVRKTNNTKDSVCDVV